MVRNRSLYSKTLLWKKKELNLLKEELKFILNHIPEPAKISSFTFTEYKRRCKGLQISLVVMKVQLKNLSDEMLVIINTNLKQKVIKFETCNTNTT